MKITIAHTQIPAAIFGILGTAILAFNENLAWLVFWAYLVSNVCWITYAVSIRSKWLMAQNAVYFIFTLIGIVRTFPALVAML